MTRRPRSAKSRPKPGQAAPGGPPAPATPALPAPAAPDADQPGPAEKLTPEEQMERFAKELKNEDWGHQPC